MKSFKARMNTPAPQYDDDYKMGAGPMKAPKATKAPKPSAKPPKLPHMGTSGSTPGNRNFGRDDHHGTTNVRSRHIDKAVGGPGGTKHINSSFTAPMGVGPHINSMPISPSGATAMNDHDGDEASPPSMLSAIPLKQSSGGFS